MKTGYNILVTFGINGSLRKCEVQSLSPYTEHYLFNSAANLKAYSNNGLDFAYYGYNAANTRSYKLSMLNQNQWVNGQPQPLNLQLQSAMFYPNAYLNFNQNGDYTKHYYNGTERIASRLGHTATSVTTTANARLSSRSNQLSSRFQEDMQELLAEATSISSPVVMTVNSLNTSGNPTDIFYYHTNHLGSTAFITDQNQNITQGFLYAPFGEITTEYASMWQNGTLPKYAFNAKELDEETGMYYYEARYYKPPVFTSRDPMMDQKPWLTPYHYCSNNPVGRVDPTGLFDKEKQAERSRKKAIKQYGENRVSGIKISESGQYYYNVSEKDEVTTNKDGYKILDDQIVLNSTTVKAGKDRSVYSRNAYKDLVKSDMRDGQLEKSFSYRAIKSMYDFDEKFQEAAYSFLSGAILYNPLVGVPNDIKTLVTGEDIYENNASKADRAFALAGIITLGSGHVLKKIGKSGSKIFKAVFITDKGIDTRSVIKTSSNNSILNEEK